jgi:hypothetical protein
MKIDCKAPFPVMYPLVAERKRSCMDDHMPWKLQLEAPNHPNIRTFEQHKQGLRHWI